MWSSSEIVVLIKSPGTPGECMDNSTSNTNYKDQTFLKKLEQGKDYRKNSKYTIGHNVEYPSINLCANAH